MKSLNQEKMSLKIAIGSDHAGYGYKQQIIQWLDTNGYPSIDFGPFSEASFDYPDSAHPLASSVEKGETNLGILICGSGNGVCMTANKHQDIRAALCWTVELAELARQHNDANVLCLPARFIDIEVALAAVQKFLTTHFEGGRHANRVNKISC